MDRCTFVFKVGDTVHFAAAPYSDPTYLPRWTSCDTVLDGICTVTLRSADPEQTPTIFVHYRRPAPQVEEDGSSDPGQVISGPEVCDGRDNDGDNWVDEDLGDQGQPTGWICSTVSGVTIWRPPADQTP